MAYLVDTSVLVRLANPNDSQYSVAANAVLELHRSGETLHISPQNLIEFHSVATRPTDVNGLGLSIAEVEAKVAIYEATFPLLEDIPGIYRSWKMLVGNLGIIGKQVHDARLIAVCHAHAVGHLLTFNVSHFLRMAAIEPGVVVVDPENA